MPPDPRSMRLFRSSSIDDLAWLCVCPGRVVEAAAATQLRTFVPLSPLPLRRRLLHLRRWVQGDLYRSSADTSCRQAPGAASSDAGLVEVVGRRCGFPSTLSIGSGGDATWTSSGLSPADVPQRRQLRRAWRVRLEVHKAAASARVLLRVKARWRHLLPLRRSRRRRVREMLDGGLRKDLKGPCVIFYFCEVFCAKYRNSCCSGVFVWFPRCNRLLI